MTSRGLERTWIRTASYGRFRGEWVKELSILLGVNIIEVLQHLNIFIYRNIRLARAFRFEIEDA